MATKPKRLRHTADREQLVKDLVRYLVEPPPKGQPRILRSSFGRGGRQHVTVIWDRWRGIPLHERSAIIVEANDSLPDKDRGELVFAVGRTMEEAIALGSFPYRVAPLLRDGDPELWGRIERALREEGAVATSEGLQLRCPTPEAAQDAYLRLQERVPGPHRA